MKKIYIPKDVDWIKDKATAMNPVKMKVLTAKFQVRYLRYLISYRRFNHGAWLYLDWPEALDKGVVCSNYTNPELLGRFYKISKVGIAVFYPVYYTNQMREVAPQKIMYWPRSISEKAGD